MKVMRNSGLLWELSVPGFRALAEAFMGGAQDPAQSFRVYAANSPAKAAICWRDEKLSFAELDESMDRIAVGLGKLGVVRGTSAVLMMRNRPEYFEMQGAITRAGAAAVSASWRSTPSELVYLATHSGAKVICFEADLWPIVEQAKKELPGIDAKNFIAIGHVPGCTPYESLRINRREDFVRDRSMAKDAAVVVYTSGTTGKPKGAIRKFPKEAAAAALRILAETPMRADDVHLLTCPLYHSTAFGFSALTHVLGGTVVVMDEFKPEQFLQYIEKFRVTTTALVPTMLHRVLQLGPEVLAKYNTRTLRAIFSCGAPLPGPLAIEAMDHFGDILFNFYGSTETGLVTLAKPHDLRAAPGTIGQAIPGNDIRLLNDKGDILGPGEPGELFVRNKLLVVGYHNDDEATRASMRDGYFSVGDLARVDQEGRYFIEGRKRDMVISGGVNVYPAEVESVLEQHPAVSEVAIVGVPDPDWGERVAAFVVAKAGQSLDDAALKVWCRERLAGPKVPRQFVFMDVLPRNPTGKVLKRDLRELAAR